MQVLLRHWGDGDRTMGEQTNIARDFIELCKDLSSNYERDDMSIHDAASHIFQVDKWSKELFFIIEMINSRIELLRHIILELNLDDDLLDVIEKEVSAVYNLFNVSEVYPKFESRRKEVRPEKLTNLRLIEPRIAELNRYPSISEGDQEALRDDIDLVLGWLIDHQLAENDFIREALIAGLREMRFMLDKFRFVGWSYSASSLKDVISAYMALERAQVSPVTNPDAEVVLRKIKTLCQKFYTKMKLAKEAEEVADFALRLYGAASLAVTPVVAISGLLK